MHSGWLMLTGALLFLGGAFIFWGGPRTDLAWGAALIVMIYGGAMHLFGLLREYI